MLSARASLEPTTSWRREPDCRLDPISWFQRKVIVREGNVWGVQAAIKMFDFVDGNELLQEFCNEVQAYESLETIQGEAIPRILAYGSLWGHYMGFLVLTLEGKQLHRGCFKFEPHLIEKAIKVSETNTCSKCSSQRCCIPQHGLVCNNGPGYACRFW
ncbi:hypothetical protein L7F22_040401 [Adiantum nelumboides]|nr:hypothetical protein [Adiantum nelumboides]